MPDVSLIIRLFISSTFSDFVFEREVLQRAVFPRLSALCAEHGCRFQPIDLRWGISAEAGAEKQTLTICFEELARCQEVSPDLNLLILLGDHYGSCFLPERILADQVARLVPHLASDLRAVFSQTYKEDLNAMPAEYVLLPTTSSEDARPAEEQLLAALAEAAQAAGFSELERQPFVASVTHLEIQHGLLDAQCDSSAVVCAFRTLDTALTEESVQVAMLKKAVERRLGPDHIWPYRASSALIEPRAAEAARKRYLEPATDAQLQAIYANFDALAEQFYQLLEPRVQQALANRQGIVQASNATAAANQRFTAERTREVFGRKDELATIETYLSMPAPFPLVVSGAAGVGKSTLLAQAVKEASYTYPEAVIVTRFIGVTPETSSLASVLTGLRREIAQRYGLSTPPPATSLAELVGAVAQQLGSLEVPPERPLLLVLDALDQLGTGTQRMDWLPPQLAKNIHVVLSLLSDRPELEDQAQRVPNGPRIQLESLNREDGQQLLRAWLIAENRRITPEQEAAILDGFASEPEGRGRPLYLRLAFEQARVWRSFEDEHTSPLPPTVPALIQQYFAWLEQPAQHGRALMEYALGSLATSRHGLAEDELLDVLSRNESVRARLHELSPSAPPIDPQRPLPVSFWARLAFRLKNYLTEREADGARLLTFYHGQVREEVELRYLSGNEKTERHADLASYFSTLPYRLDAKGLTSQAAGIVVSERWNLRKLAELAYQQAQEGSPARAELAFTLTDGRFLEGKLTAEGIAPTLDELNLLSDNQGIKKIARAVRGGAIQLARNPADIQNEITGRVGRVLQLHDFPTRVGPWLRLQSHSLMADPALLRLLQGHTGDISSCALNKDGNLALSSSTDGTLRLWDTTSGEALRIMDGFGPGITSCALSADGQVALAAAGRVLHMWNTANGKTTLLRGHAGKITSCAVSADGTIALSGSSDRTLRVWNTANGETLSVLRGHTGEVTHCAISADGKRALSASGKAALSSAIDHTLRLWNTDNGKTLHIWKIAKISELASCALSANGQRVFAVSNLLGGILGRATLRVYDATSGRRVRTLKGFKGIVASCALSANGGIALSGSRTAFVGTAMEDQARKSCLLALLGAFWVFDNFEGSTLRLWDTKSGKTLRLLLGHKDTVSLCAVSADGRIVLSASSDVVDNTPLADPAEHHALRVWDTASEDPSLVREPFAGPITGCALSANGRRALSFAKSAKTLCVWDTSDEQSLEQPLHRLKHKQSVVSCALSADGKHALSISYDGWLRLWDTDNGKLVRRWLFPILTAVSSCALSANGRQALSSRRTGLCLWDTTTGETLPSFSIYSDDEPSKSTITKMWMRGFAMSTDGERALIVPKEGAPQLWDIAHSHMLRTLAGNIERIDNWALSANGQRALFAFEDGRLELWNTDNGQATLTLTGHTDFIPSCSLSASGRLAVSASFDRTLRLWDTINGRELARWTHDITLCQCALSADGYTAMAGDIDGGVHFLQVEGVSKTGGMAADISPVG